MFGDNLYVNDSNDSEFDGWNYRSTGLPADEPMADARPEEQDGDEHIDFLSAKQQGLKEGLRIFKLSCAGYPDTFETAPNQWDAWPQAKRRGWARDGGEVRTVQVNLDGAEIVKQGDETDYPVEFCIRGEWHYLASYVAYTPDDATEKARTHHFGCSATGYRVSPAFLLKSQSAA